jgi:hypothetical protein
MKKIFWKPAHRLLVAQKSFLIKRDPMFTGSDLDAVRRAQEFLPAELHRDLGAFAMVAEWIQPMWDELADQGYSESSSFIIPTVRPAVAQEREVHRQIQIGEFDTQDLIGELMRRMTEATDPIRIRNLVREEVNSVLAQSLPGFVPAVEAAPEAPTHLTGPHLHRVLIIGLQGSQIEIMKTRYKGKLDLHFMSGGEGGSRVKGMVQNMEMTIRTRWCKGILESKGWPNFTFINGGLDSIRRIINERFHIKENA